jgi:hypothetical protein
MTAPVRQHLLPGNATALERAVSETLDRMPELSPGIAALHAFKFRQPNTSILPWLVMEYGLGPVTPYLPDLATVIAYGIRWSRLKGTPQGVREALTWLGYAFDRLDEAPTRRRRWHLFALKLDRFWDREADLDRIEAVGRMSQPARSIFWRGFRGYDVRALDWSYSRWGNSIWGDSSGVRLHDGGVKWSFGRVHEPAGGSYAFTQAELTALGAWVEPVEDASIGWGPFPWTTAGLTWQSSGEIGRQKIIAAALLPKSFWVVLRRPDGTVIGARKARAVHCVVPQLNGRYSAGGSGFEPSADLNGRIYVEAMTGFGEGNGETVAAWALVIGGAPPAGTKPGIMWLAGDALAGGTIVGDFAAAAGTVIGRTDRERFRAIFRI